MIMGIYSTSHACQAYQEGQRLEFIQHGRDDYPLYPLQPENIVFSFHMPYNIRISDLHHEDSLGFTTVPDLFPGAIYRMLKPAVAMLIFESGSIMVLGVRDHTDLKIAIEAIRPVLDQHAYHPDATPKPRKRSRNVAAADMKEEMKKKKKEETAQKKLAKQALKSIKYAPVRNKAEFDELFKKELERLRHVKAEEEKDEDEIVEEEVIAYGDMPDIVTAQ